MEKLRVGIIGPGRVAKRLANALNNIENAILHSVCSRNIERALKFIEENATGITAAYDNYQVFLKDKNLDAVIVSTPDTDHTYYIIEAIKAGKHVFVEKPLCTNLSDAKSILEICHNYPHLKLAVGYHLRWHDGLRMLSQYIKNNDMGTIFHMKMCWAHTFIKEANWRNSLASSKWWSLSALGTHCLDIARWYLLPNCGEVKKVTCITSNTLFGTTDESALLSLEFGSGAMVSIYTSILFDSPLNLELFSSNTHVIGEELTGDEGKRKITVNGKKIHFQEKSNLYIKELNNFIGSIQSNHDPEVTGKEAYKNIECLLKNHCL